MGTDKSLNYSTIKQIITTCQDNRTKALISFQYGFGCRAGELAMRYSHKYKVGKFISSGPIIADFSYKKEQAEIVFLKPNFKQVKEKDRRSGEIIDVKRFPSFVSQYFEPWLYKIIHSWLSNKETTTPLFRLKVSRIRGLIDKELKKHSANASSHWLRHSRAYHIGEITADPYAVQAVLGHADPRTSMAYVSQMRKSIYKAMEGGKTFEDYLGKVVV